MQKVFVFTSYGIKDVNDIYLQFAEKCGYSVLTCEENVFEICQRKNINAVLLPSAPRKFRRSIKDIDIAFLVLAGDSYYGITNYLARHYRSAFIHGIAFNALEFWQKKAAEKQNSFYLQLYKALGMTSVLFGKHLIVYEESLKGVIRAFIEKINWDFKPGLYLHGKFCDLIFLQAEREREIWQKNGSPVEKIRVTGVIQADWIFDNLLNCPVDSSGKVPSSDMLFFAQPLYQYSSEPRYLEELELFVNECNKMGIKLLIKLHPRDDIKIYERFESDKCHIIEHHKGWRDTDNVALIQKTKVVVVKGSSSMIVPLLMQKPVMYLDFFDSDMVHIKYYLEPKLLLSKIEDIKEKFLFATDPVNSSFIAQHQKEILSIFGSWDGQSWRRIKNDITQFLEQTDPPADLQGA